MRHRLVRTLAAVGLLGGLAVGCRDATAPRSVTVAQVSGTYTLRSVAGRALPTSVPILNTWTDWVVADTVVLRPDGTFTRAYHAAGLGDGPWDDSWQASGTWAVRSDTTVVTVPATWTGGAHASEAFAAGGDGTLAVRRSGNGSPYTAVYTR